MKPAIKACSAVKQRGAGKSAALLESAVFPLINLTFSRDGISKKDFLIPKANKIASAKKRDLEN